MSESTRKSVFHFRPVSMDKAEAVAKLIALAETGAIVLEEKTKDGATVAIQRKVESYDLPVFTADEIVAVNPAFLADLLHNAVEVAARKMFVDNGGEATAISVEDVIRCNTAQARVSVPAELIKEFAEWVAASLTEQGQPAGTVGIISALITGKFNSGVCNKFAKNAEQFPMVLEIAKGFSGAESAKAEYVNVTNLLDTNLTNWIEEQATKSDELDLSGFSI